LITSILQLWSPNLPGSGWFVGGHNCKIDVIKNGTDPALDGVALLVWAILDMSRPRQTRP
jgi:hypothetical protein